MKRLRAFVTTMVLGCAVVACAAQDKRTAASPSAPAGEAGPAERARPSTGDASMSAPQAAPPPPPAPATEPPRQPTAGARATPGTSRTVALSQASTEIESSQRELDVAGGDCRNACRALGSMDRAAGRICGLAQTNDEQRRCGEAKTRVYSARDKVRSTCGTCPDVSVERDAPIPSR